VRLSTVLSSGILPPHIGAAFGGAGHGCVGAGGSALLEARLVAELALLAPGTAGPVRLTAPLLLGDLGGARTLPAAEPTG
jgi:hypothetical protein